MSDASVQVSAADILADFVRTCETQGKLPASLSAFAERQAYSLREIKAHFGSLQKLEQAVFLAFFEETQRILRADEAYAQYGFEEKALALYYTFFEVLGANQDYARLSLTQGLLPVQNLPKLQRLKQAFQQHILQIREPAPWDLLPLLRLPAERLLAESAWLQFLGVLHFWLGDRSQAFERSDVLIEKSLAAGFEVLAIVQLRSVVDLIKFWMQEQQARR